MKLQFERNTTDYSNNILTVYARTKEQPTIKEVTKALKTFIRKNVDTMVPAKDTIYVRVSHVQYGWSRSFAVTVHGNHKQAKATHVAEFKGNKKAKVMPIETQNLRPNV